MNQFIHAEPGSVGTGTIMGQAFVSLLLAALVVKCFSIARRPNANAKCALSLGVAVCALIVAAWAGIVGRLSPILHALMILGGLISLVAIIAAAVLAIIGLVEYGNREGQYTQGRAQAIWTLSLAFLLVCFVMYGVSRRFQQVLLNRLAVKTNQPEAGQWLVFDNFNFKIRAPGKPWVQWDAKKLNKNATVAFAQTDPQVFFIIVAENTGASPDMTTDGLAEIAKANLRSRTLALQILKENPVRRQGLDGVQMDSDAQIQAYHLFYRHWLFATNGYIYQLIAWGNIDDAAAVRDRSEELFSAFNLIDAQRKSAKNISDFHSDLFGYTVKMAGSGWRRSSLMAKNLPSAEFTAWDQAKEVGLFVVPICLMDQDPHAEAVSQAMAALFNVAYPGPDIQDEKPIVQGELSGVEFGFDRLGSTGKLAYRFRVLKSRHWAYLIGADGQAQREDNGKLLEEALGRVEFSPQAPPPANFAQKFNDWEKHRHGLLFNDMGLFYYNARQYEKSAAYFRIAFEFERTSGIFLGNVAKAYQDAGKPQEALDYIESNPTPLAGSQSARATQAYLQSQLEQVDKALTNFAALFAEGYRNDNYFVTYADLLSQTRQQDVALAAVEDYLKENDSPAIRLLEARLYKQKKNFVKAIDLLKTQSRKYPYNTELTFSLADAYQQAGLYAESVEVCQQLIDAQSDTAGVYYMKGCSEFGLKRYREAKASFEAALEKAPASVDAKNYLNFVSGMLGEGSNSELKKTIAPVPIPEKLINAAPSEAPPSYTKDYGAKYLKEITAISFTKNKEFKRTDYSAIKVIDSTGIAAFTTVQFGFDPLREAIFVNDLKVKDQKGEVVAAGKVDDYYVVDDTSTTQASQKKILNIPVSGLRPGSLIELTVTRKDLAPPEDFPFTAHSCINTFPILDDIFLIQGQTNALKFAGLGANNGLRCEGALYWLRQQPEIYKWEPLEQSPEGFAPTLYVGDGTATWNGQVTNYLGQLGDYMQLDAAERELAGRIVKDSSDESGKVFSLARYMQANYTYKALEFGRRARLPHKASEIAHNQYGDCKDHALLLQQMLEASGIPARLALVKTHGKVLKELPSLDQFDHMIVYLPAFQNGFFIDCTDKGSDLSQAAPLGLAGKEALILDAANPKFVTIPDYPDGSSTIHSRREVCITNGTDVVVHEVLNLGGYDGSTMRTYLKGLQPAARRNFIDVQLNRASGEATAFDLQNLEDTQAPLILKLDYILKRQFHLAGNQLVGKLPDVWEQIYVSAVPVEHRTTPFELNFPMDVESKITVATPEGYQELALENFRQNLQMAFGTSQSEARKEGSGLKIDYKLQRRAGTFAATEYSPYQENMVKALGPLEQTVAFTKSP